MFKNVSSSCLFHRFKTANIHIDLNNTHRNTFSVRWEFKAQIQLHDTPAWKLRNSAVCPQSAFVSLAWFSQRKELISPCSVNRLQAVMEPVSSLVADGNRIFIYLVLYLWTSGMSARELRFDPRAVHIRNFVGWSGTLQGFSPSISVFPCQYHPTNAPYSSSS